VSAKRLGRQTIRFGAPPSVIGHGNVVGKKEGEGPLKDSFDMIVQDSLCGQKTWEKAESEMQKQALATAMQKAAVIPSDLQYIFGGDLLNQCIATSYHLKNMGIPFFGLYGACSTMAESAALAAMSIDGGFATHAAAVTSSHFSTAERQYRTPLAYGGQRTPTAQWTATAAGAVVLAESGAAPYVRSIPRQNH
jgi:stage V sporulation protein AD